MDEAGIKIPDYDAMWRERRARHAAFDAARARARGKDQEQAREIYVEELHARELTVPSEPVLSEIVDAITGGTLYEVRLLAKGLADIGKGLHGIYKMQRQPTDELHSDKGGPTHL